MRIAQVASEFSPLMEVGNLASVVAGLAGEMAAAGHEVEIYLPGCRCALEHPRVTGAKELSRINLSLPMGGRFETAEVITLAWDQGIRLHLIQRDEYFDRSHIYGPKSRDYDDNDARFIFFGKAVVEALARSGQTVDILHAHDWTGALVPLLVRVTEAERGLSLAVKTVLTVHNIAFQGLFPDTAFSLTNLPDEFFHADSLEYFGQINCLKAGIVYSDALVTVSEGYRSAILTAEGGHGLDGILATRDEQLAVIPQGIDTMVWDPSSDPALAARFSAENPGGRARCREALLQAAAVEAVGTNPLVAMIDPPTDGLLELVTGPLGEFLRETGGGLVVAAGGRDTRVDAIDGFVKELGRDLRGRIALWPAARPHEVRALLAGADYFLMPADDEPGGPLQLQAQRYGCVPAASRAGGLVDTIEPLGEARGGGTGFLFDNTPASLRAALAAIADLHGRPEELARVRRRLLLKELSWRAPARAYLRMFQGLL